MKAAIALASWLVLMPAVGLAGERYDPRKAGHPLRIAAYVLHPVGVVLDYLIFRPAWWIGQFEPIRTLVGREPSREELLGGLENVPATDSASAPITEPTP
jgi:hypothetical protein